MVRGMGVATFTCDSFHLIDTWMFFSLNEKEPDYEGRESSDFFCASHPSG